MDEERRGFPYRIALVWFGVVGWLVGCLSSTGGGNWAGLDRHDFDFDFFFFGKQVFWALYSQYKYCMIL
ncbi:hypothetical protein L873DRAFT_1802501 [Choiromyces venosus 120613-1]|uniref:Uncharacterized protein n=1 Tax=Choiromyces venosus 120613-1 TaxID=1336337 RepID=A0A3N4JV51_9PEZI|nr:hypothetical protein L873DRAFT_1802501 [Choiromyces venosus 120613-1]